jgi:hypothetical protein
LLLLGNGNYEYLLAGQAVEVRSFKVVQKQCGFKSLELSFSPKIIQLIYAVVIVRNHSLLYILTYIALSAAGLLRVAASVPPQATQNQNLRTAPT